jgi:hypothetical protein
MWSTNLEGLWWIGCVFDIITGGQWWTSHPDDYLTERLVDQKGISLTREKKSYPFGSCNLFLRPSNEYNREFFRLFPRCCLQRAGWMTEESRFDTSGNKTFFNFSKASRPALILTQTSYLIGAGISLHALKADGAWSLPLTFIWCRD